MHTGRGKEKVSPRDLPEATTPKLPLKQFLLSCRTLPSSSLHPAASQYIDRQVHTNEQ
jgi:hemolysin activation/secretion protein